MKQPKKLIIMPAVTAREHAAILVALRVAQCGTNHDQFVSIWKEFHGKGLGPAPTNDDIDVLCEKVNCGSQSLSQFQSLAKLLEMLDGGGKAIDPKAITINPADFSETQWNEVANESEIALSLSGSDIKRHAIPFPATKEQVGQMIHSCREKAKKVRGDNSMECNGAAWAADLRAAANVLKGYLGGAK